MPTIDAYLDVVNVPRPGLRLPVVLPLPDGFDPDRPETWPPVEGRLEYVQGRLLFMPPCGDRQARTAVDVATELSLWQRSHQDFVVGANEAGMKLGGDVRGADAAVWKRSDAGVAGTGMLRVAPVLAVEIAGQDEDPDALLEKARWYLARGVEVVWILDPATLSAKVVTPRRAAEVEPGTRIPAHPALPGLEPLLQDLFRQVGS